jgi:hypothetical protein
MSMNPEDFSPVAFNPYKHHLGFLKQKITNWRTQPWDEAEREIIRIGSNLIDVYYGSLTVRQIFEEVLKFAGKEGLTDAIKMAQWLGHEEYRKTMLSDNSLWIVRQGLNPGYFLHIHPAKHSIYTLRIRASTLKTVVALKVFKLPEQKKIPDLQVVNYVRQTMVGLSPIKRIEQDKGISRIWSLFKKL